ncbi:MAG: cation:proton antiporter [Planctomycetes bacterium]|nr:cation:proton antiporter [Planctomycetota bacterium]
MHAQIAHDIGLAIMVATVLAFAAKLARQPVLLAYIGAGMLVGRNLGFGWIHEQASLDVLGEIGLAFLMFIVGLEMDLKKLLKSSRDALILGLVQVVASAVLLWGAAFALGYRGLPALYLGVAGAFSSTMIVVKLLSDKRVIDTLAGRMVLAVLLIQDAIAIVVLGLQPNLTSPQALPILLSLAKGAGLVVGAVAAARFLLPRLLALVAMLPEVLLLTAISWCFLVAGLAVACDFSVAMGALIAGATLGGLPYALDVIAKIRGLRDFFVTLFFVALGGQLQRPSAGLLGVAALFSAAVVASRVFTVLPTLLALRYDARIGILTCIDLVPASEFSIVIVSLGAMRFGHVPQEIVTIIVLAMILTATLTTYAGRFDKRLVQFGAAALARLGLRGRARAEGASTKEDVALLILGCHRITSALLPRLRERTDYRIVDFNPAVHRDLAAGGYRAIYGDLSHAETLEEAGIHHAQVVLSTISDDFLHGTSNAALVAQARRLNPHAVILATAERRSEARRVYDAGADFVLIPKLATAEEFARTLAHAEAGERETLRQEGLAQLEGKGEVLD